MRLRKYFAALVAAAGLLAVSATSATANSIVVTNTSITNGVGFRDFTYTVELTFANEVEGNSGNPDFFTIFDFQGLISLTTTGLVNTDFTFSNPLTGKTPALLVATAGLADDPTLRNLSFTKNAGVIENNNISTGLNMSLGTIVARTSVANPIANNPGETYVYQDTTRIMVGSPPVLVVAGKGQDAHNTTVPFDINGPFETPLPSAACGGLGLMGLLGIRRVRRSVK